MKGLCNPYQFIPISFIETLKLWIFKIFLLIILLNIEVLFSVYAQGYNQYSLGINSLGNYGIQFSRINANSITSFSYVSFKNLLFNRKVVDFNYNLFDNQNFIDISYYRINTIGLSMLMYYGGKIDLASNYTNKANLNNNLKNIYNISLHVGVKYKITENLSIGAEFKQKMGNMFFDHSLELFDPFFHNEWLKY